MSLFGRIHSEMGPKISQMVDAEIALSKGVGSKQDLFNRELNSSNKVTSLVRERGTQPFTGSKALTNVEHWNDIESTQADDVRLIAKLGNRQISKKYNVQQPSLSLHTVSWLKHSA